MKMTNDECRMTSRLTRVREAATKPGAFRRLSFAICHSSFVILLASSAFAESVLFKAAVVHPVSGPALAPGQVLVRDGKIAEVGATISQSADRTVDLGALQLFPGLIAADTDLGLIEISSVRGSVDVSEVGEFSPDVTSWVAFNPDSELIAVARANGITHAHVVPEGGAVAGQSGLLALAGWTWEEMSVRRPVAMHVYWPNFDLNIRTSEGGGKKPKPLDEQAKERAKKLKALDDFFSEAEAYDHARTADPKIPLVPAWEAMMPLVRGEVPLMIHAQDARQIKAAVEWASGKGFRVILAGARDAHMLAGYLAEKHVPVIYEQTFAQPAFDWQPYDVQFRAAEVLR
ncbi:MAG: hypothetical protein HY301_18485, partial [Verrucomicrobia bacterium]|nr:hypothetical protein [Verrucomicrobiota bacterium]